MGGLFRGWPDAVGVQVAAHARPIVLDRGRLVVEVDEPGWATQLRFLEADLVARLRPYVAPEPIESVEIRVAGAKAARNRSGRRTS
jgi:predicted nucleic acid-binding Zn ribbon protein